VPQRFGGGGARSRAGYYLPVAYQWKRLFAGGVEIFDPQDILQVLAVARAGGVEEESFAVRARWNGMRSYSSWFAIIQY
jgi:hypothetical protein